MIYRERMTGSRIKTLAVYTILAILSFDSSHACAERSGCPLMKKAAEQGDPDREFLFAQALDKGYCGFAVDKKQAEHWYLLSAKQGNSQAQLKLGDLYSDSGSQPVERNYKEAYFWYSLAVMAKEEEALVSRERVTKHLTADELVKLKARLNVWKPKK